MLCLGVLVHKLMWRLKLMLIQWRVNLALHHAGLSARRAGMHSGWAGTPESPSLCTSHRVRPLADEEGVPLGGKIVR